MIEYEVERLGDVETLGTVSNLRARKGWTLHSFHDAGGALGFDIIAVYQRESRSSEPLKPRDPKTVEYP